MQVNESLRVNMYVCMYGAGSYQTVWGLFH